MANYLPPGLQGIDFTQWQTWPVVSINGIGYYQVPGRPEYVFDPNSGPYGQVLQNGNTIRDAQAKYAESQQPGIGDQLIPVVGGIAGTAGGIYAGSQLAGIGAKEVGKEVIKDVAVPELVGASRVPVVGGGTTASTGGVTTTAGAPVIGGAPTVGAYPGATSLGSIGSVAVPAAIAGIGGYQAIKGYEEGDPIRGGLGGAAFGAGGLGTAAALGLTGPVGWGALGLAALGGGALGGGLAGFNRQTTTNVEAKRINNLDAKGIKHFGDTNAPDEKRGASKQLSDNINRYGIDENFAGYTPDGRWVNNRWLKTNDVNSLYAQDIWGYSAFPEEFGSAYYEASPDARSKIASWALEHGLINEGKGTINISGPKDLQEEWKQYSAAVLSGQDQGAPDFRSKWDYDVQSKTPQQPAQQQSGLVPIAEVRRPDIRMPTTLR